MTSREAFEEFCRKGDQEVGKILDRDEVGYTNLVVAACFEAWQAAIQHASDVAVKACEEISEREHRDFKGLNPGAHPGKRGNSYVEGLSDGADLAADAIKEALK